LMTYTFNGLMTFAVVCGVMLQRSFCAVAWPRIAQLLTFWNIICLQYIK
jgi:hypothetical protein